MRAEDTTSSDDGIVLPRSTQGQLLLGGSLLVAFGALVVLLTRTAVDHPGATLHVDGTTVAYAFGLVFAAMGLLMCVAAAAAYGVVIALRQTAQRTDGA